MKLLALILFLSTTAFAAEPKTYDLNMDFVLKNKKFGPAVSTVKENEPKKVIQKIEDGEIEIEVTVVPKKNGPVDSLSLKFLITSSIKGVRALIGQPQILARENKKTTITMGPKSKPPNMVLTVLAKSKKPSTTTANP